MPREATARVLEELGHDVSPARIDAVEAPDIGFLGIYASAITRDLERWSARRITPVLVTQPGLTGD